ncbi:MULTISPECIES: NUDIX domain-containing protein [unclassified Paenibacillus]|uniref:NUDIX domain-containing protein n=1 Tax=unclassified Paenibacillus TaxID=185978 RepID=UPI000953EB27|nr:MULTISPECIES: NUDIX domain-containing protein [unclassified Paenibacillus]ASS65771.1 NUDIX domain-containing protein [Paenibacillus sp. RUD330]SIQ24379.1 8-oxo-dGTP diphosphatase [Paenibacillus sp. RU4X]SIQ46151.1 8-oxo-dGTP diphosphatase [Paenibacillus sp. RU4T]
MKLRQMATAFISRDGHYIMMEKDKSRWFGFPFWTALGGHLEPEEISDPDTAVRREILEESGLLLDEVTDLMLRYVLMRQKDDEIRIQYVYFGRTEKAELVNSDEGKLHWIAEHELTGLHLSAVIREMLLHYFRHRDERLVYSGTIKAGEDEEAVMQWSELKDPQVF